MGDPLQCLFISPFPSSYQYRVFASVKTIKYIHKYIYKKSNQTIIALHLQNNKVIQHLHRRYIGPMEAV